jgi:hypothetical protein
MLERAVRISRAALFFCPSLWLFGDAAMTRSTIGYNPATPESARAAAV